MGLKYFLNGESVPDFYHRSPEPKSVPKVTAEYKGAMVLDMLDAPDVVGTEQMIGFSVVDLNGKRIRQRIPLLLAAFSDANLTQISVNSIFDTAATGSFQDPAEGGANYCKVVTDENGEFACRLVCSAKETIRVACQSIFGGPCVNCTEVDSVTFS